MMPPSEAESRRDEWARADPERRRQLIVDVALVLLEQEGLEAVTMRHIAAQLEIGAMTVYSYVDCREDLHQAVVRRGLEMLQAAWTGAAGDPSGDWREVARRYLDFARNHPRLYELVFSRLLSHESLSGPLSDSGFLETFEQMLRQRLSRETSTTRRDPSARRLLTRFWSTLHGLVLLENAGALTALAVHADDLLEDLLDVEGDLNTGDARDTPGKTPRR